MLINRINLKDSSQHVMEINVTCEQLENWRNGMNIKAAMPNLTKEERLFIMSGIILKKDK